MRSEALLFLALAGCSLGNVKQELCTDSEACRDAFGFGWTCGDAGTCEPIVPPERCGRAYPEDLFDRPEEHPDVLVFGALFDLGTDLENVKSAELAFYEANVQDGLDGREVGFVSCSYEELVAFDNDSSDVAAQNALRWLAEDVGVKGIVGPAASQIAVDVWPIVEEHDLFMISPSATAVGLTTLDGETSTDEAPGLFWRTAPPDGVQASIIQRDIVARGSEAVAVIYQDGLYGSGLADRLQAELSIPADRMFPYENPVQLTAAISDVGAMATATTVDEVVFVSSRAEEVSDFLNGASGDPGYATLPIFLTDVARDASVLEGAQLATALFPNIRGTNPVADPDAQSSDFYIAYLQRYGDDASADGFNAFAYDAAWLALYGSSWAVQQEGELSGTTIARGLRKVSSGDAVQVRAASWASVQEQFAAGTSIDVQGASGALDFDATTGETTNVIAIWSIAPSNDDFVEELLCIEGAACEAL